MTAQAPVRVFVVDDHELVRVGMRTFLDLMPDIELVGDAADGLDALEHLGRLAGAGRLPDVVLMDLVMRGMDGVATIRALKQAHPGVEVIVVTSFGDARRVRGALEAGAGGYVLKDADVDEIVFAIRAARRGEVHLDAAVTRTLTRSIVAPHSGGAALTSRERDVLALLGGGRSNREIGAVLSIGERTVQTHLSNVLTKLDLRSRTQAALWAVREGLVEL